MIYRHGVEQKCSLDAIFLNLGEESSFFRYWFAEFAFKGEGVLSELTLCDNLYMTVHVKETTKGN